MPVEMVGSLRNKGTSNLTRPGSEDRTVSEEDTEFLQRFFEPSTSAFLSV